MSVKAFHIFDSAGVLVGECKTEDYKGYENSEFGAYLNACDQLRRFGGECITDDVGTILLWKSPCFGNLPMMQTVTTKVNEYFLRLLVPDEIQTYLILQNKALFEQTQVQQKLIEGLDSQVSELNKDVEHLREMLYEKAVES